MNSFVDIIKKISKESSLDPKRTRIESQGVRGWYPYYAGYSEDFVEKILKAVNEEFGSVRVLDPWNGSGTTTSVAHRLGHEPFGFDMNPVLSIVSSAKNTNADDALHLTGLAHKLASSPKRTPHPNDPLLTWIDPQVVAQYRGIEAALIAQLATTNEGKTLHPDKDVLPPIAAFLLLALIRTTRMYTSIKQSSNPTWIRPGGKKRQSDQNLGKKWIDEIIIMANDLKLANKSNEKNYIKGKLGIADSRKLPLDDASIDFILTSPPYCTRIDYVINSSFELAALGIGNGSPEFTEFRRALMGTPLTRKGDPPEMPENWPFRLRGLLESIRTHRSKGSSSYYYKTFHQYFSDAEASLKELHRVLRPSGLALFVLQTSYYKELCVDLPSLYVDLGMTLGFKGEITGQTAVRRALAQIHPHSFNHRKESQYREAVVALEKAA